MKNRGADFRRWGDDPKTARASAGSTPDEIIDAMIRNEARRREEWKRRQFKKVGRKVRPVPKGIR